MPKTDILAEVACGIRAARKEKEWTQGELATRVGVDVKTIRNYETKASPPDIVTLQKIADATGKSLPFILGIERPGSELERRRAELKEKTVSLKDKSLDDGEGPPLHTSAEFLGGYFEVADNKITIDIIVRGPEERIRLGGWRSREPDSEKKEES